MFNSFLKSVLCLRISLENLLIHFNGTDIFLVLARYRLSPFFIQALLFTIFPPNSYISPLFPSLFLYPQRDCKILGLRRDWRRSMNMSSENSVFQSFIDWQFQRLYEKNHIAYEPTPMIWSEAMQSPCLDHDRREGDSALPAEHLLLAHRLLDCPHHVRMLTTRFGADMRTLWEHYTFVCPAAIHRCEVLCGETALFVAPHTTLYGYCFDPPQENNTNISNNSNSTSNNSKNIHLLIINNNSHYYIRLECN